MGVFDGVGGWARHGVDPRVYAQVMLLLQRQIEPASQMLMEGCKAELEKNGQNASQALAVSI